MNFRQSVGCRRRGGRTTLLTLGLLGLGVVGYYGLAGTSWSHAADAPPPVEFTAVTADQWMADAIAQVDTAPALPAPVADETPLPDEIRWFNGRPIRAARRLQMRVTAYSPDERSCGASADGITASGYSVRTNGMKMVAADTGLLPFGTLVSVPGYHDGQVVPVLDRGGLIKGERLDVLYPTHHRAMRWGVQHLPVVIWEYADGRPDDFRTRHR